MLNAKHAHGMLAVLSLQYLDDCPLLDTNSDGPPNEGYGAYDDPYLSRPEMNRCEQMLQDM